MSSSELEHATSGTGTITSEMAVSMLNSAFSRVSLPHIVTSMTHVLKPGVAALYLSEILESWMMKRQTYGDGEGKKMWKEEEGPTLRLQHALDTFASALGLDLSHIHCASIVYGYRDHVLHCIQLIDTLFNVLDHEKADRDAEEEQEKPRYDEKPRFDKHKEIEITQNDSLLEDLDYLENFLARTKSHLESPQRPQHHTQRPRTAPTSTKHPLPISAEVSYDALDDANTSLEKMAQRMGYEETHADQISNLARYVHQRKYHTPTKKSYRAEHGVSHRLYQSPTDEPEHWESRKHKLAYTIYKNTKALGSHVSSPSSSSYAAACARVDTLGASRRRADASVYQQLLRLIRSDDTVNAVQRKKMTGEIEAELGRRQARLAYWEEVAFERARRLERARKNQDDAAYRRFLSDELAVVISKLEAKRLATEKWYQDQYDMLREDVAAEKRWKEIQNKRDREAVRGYRRELKQATRDAIELGASRLSSASEAYRALIQPDEARLTYRPETSVHTCSSRS